MKTEQIMDAVVVALTNLATIGGNVKRAQVYASPDASLPGLVVYMGADTLADELQTSLIDWQLTVTIESRVKTTAQLDELLNTIRGEVHQALMTRPTLGLNFVHDIKPVSASEPELSGEGDKPIATQRLEFSITYRTARTNLD